MDSPQAYRYEQASVLYSGGTDSTLAAVEMLKECRRVTLLTFNPGFIFFIENSRVHADVLVCGELAGRVDMLLSCLRRVSAPSAWHHHLCRRSRRR